MVFDLCLTINRNRIVYVELITDYWFDNNYNNINIQTSLLHF